MKEEYLNEGADTEMLEELKTVSVAGRGFSYLIIRTCDIIHLYMYMYFMRD